MELVQNAADAARRAGAPTRVVVRVAVGIDSPAELRVGSVGEPLDTAGVAALASLRASSKREGEGVGRFGVGFAAVTAVSDAPRVVTRRPGGDVAGVAFDRLVTAVEVERLGGATAAELARRGGDAPALRLVWPVRADEPPLAPGITTEVRLPVRGAAVGTVEDLLATARAQAGDLLLALRWVDAVEIDGEEIRRTERGEGPVITVEVGGVGWRLHRAAGDLPAHLLADLPVEERGATRWEATWAVREGHPDPVPRDVLHAPTPTDDATTLPARLVATVPLDPDRRHVRPGAVTTHVLRAAAAHYPDLVASRPPERCVDLLPRPALPASEVDGLLRDAVLSALATHPWVPPAAPDGAPLVARRAVVLDVDPAAAGALTTLLADVLADLAHPALAAPRHAAALAAVGVTRLGPAGLCDALAGVDRPPSWWRTVYGALALDPAVRHGAAGELAALPVPLADGRTVVGARGCLLPDDLDAFVELLADAEVPGLRLVAPGAAHPVLTTLGARPAGAAALLAEPALRAAVERSIDDADAGLDVDPLARLVLALVAAAPPGAGTAPWLGALALRAHDTGRDDGGHEGGDGEEYRRADELVLPDAALRPLLPDDTPFGVLTPGAGAAPRAALLAVGVLDGFAVLRDDAPSGPDHDLDDEEAWWAEQVGELGPGAGEPGPMLAVRDLDLVDPRRWAAAWPVLAADRDVRAAVAAAPGAPLPYTAWWLARHARLDGLPPTAWRAADAEDLAGLFDPVPEASDVDPAFLAACGVRTTLDVAGPDDAADLLDRLADPDRAVGPTTALAAHSALAAALAAGRVDVEDLEPPVRVRTDDGTVAAADPAGAGPAPVVVDRPWVAAVLPPAGVVSAPPAGARDLADLLDLETGAERYDAAVSSTGVPTPWSALPGAASWAAALGRRLPAGEMVRHERLRVTLTDRRTGRTLEVTPGVWVVSSVVHADEPLRALLGSLGG